MGMENGREDGTKQGAGPAEQGRTFIFQLLGNFSEHFFVFCAQNHFVHVINVPAILDDVLFLPHLSRALLAERPVHAATPLEKSNGSRT